MEILIDKRIELMTVIQTLCNYWDSLAVKFTGNLLYRCKYKENVEEYFGKYKNHGTIRLYKDVCNDVMDISAFINMALCYSNPPELNSIADCENNFGGINSLMFPYQEFVNGTRKFYIDTCFEQFYKNNQNEYTSLVNNYGDKTELSENVVFDYLENKIRDYTIIISPLVMGCYGIKVNTNKNKLLQYSVISPYDYKENKYIFGTTNLKRVYIWHEISHLTINDLTRAHINRFYIHEKHIPEIFMKHCYPNVETIINEYVIRGITIRLFEMAGEERFVESLIGSHIQKGFKEIELVKEYIKENCEENNKFIKDDRYKNLMEYIINKI
jgi:hypothetical protein